MRRMLIFLAATALAFAHEGHGKKTAPASAKALKNPLSSLSCQAADGKAQTAEALKMRPEPTNLVDHRMDSMTDGEIFRVVTNGIGKSMPGFKTQLNDADRWRIVAYVPHLRKAQARSEHHG
jgi:hypothetical protein